ncbi:hypothetical protein BCR35DRAFT_336317 [Leucosporidium creatinivorum]|uniref:Uncharacterized protein n=1 Tax=Leucosporidium creatinivorum TaxID=106004 RepID=A0A1Y2CB64_9BASI|nr:hypothetical protein BCR35DRAFT_336317 [Leucosporidium creatinivorum]
MSANREAPTSTTPQHPSTSLPPATSASSALDAPPSFGTIRPLQAAQSFFAHSTQLGPWQVHLTDRAIKSLRLLRDRSAQAIVCRKVEQLTHGHFSESNTKPMCKSFEEESALLFHAKLSRNLRLVWQVDLLEEDGGHRATQIIKIISVESHDSMDAKRWLWMALVAEQRARGRQYK